MPDGAVPVFVTEICVGASAVICADASVRTPHTQVIIERSQRNGDETAACFDMKVVLHVLSESARGIFIAGPPRLCHWFTPFELQRAVHYRSQRKESEQDRDGQQQCGMNSGDTAPYHHA